MGAAGTPGWRITLMLPDVAAGGLWAGGPPTAARSPRTPLPRTSGSQPVVQSLTWIPGTDPQWAAGDLSSAGDGTAVLEYGT